MEDSPGWNNHPRSLNELLKLTLKLSESEMKEYKTMFTEMDPDRRAWLSEAMRNALENTDTKKLMESVNFLRERASDPSAPVLIDSDLELCSQHFEVIAFIVEDIDHAKDFAKMGGLAVAVQYLKSPYSSLQWRAAEAIAASTQNNPFVQSSAVQCNAIPTLIYVLENSDIDIVQVKCMHALSQIVGRFKPAEVLFIRLEGLRVIAKGLVSTFAKLKIKAAFLLQKLIEENVGFLSDVLKAKIHVLLINGIKSSKDDSGNIFAALLLRLAEISEVVKIECRKPENVFQDFLVHRIANVHDDDAQVFMQLKSVCFSETN